ncbi:hypothetical protein AZE42_09510, partial [Rhizopogon vesiculosus]
ELLKTHTGGKRIIIFNHV